ncbi:virulence factor family protein [Scleromatobacter humisilvae]|uniref:Type IV secretion system protein VirJ n=1 Tax=Scleromatobacter humisilvae TaxID=2897159 RepID=A0A9X2BYJ9_9BURK|nr:AcvB/VirJ family lysyl-phosphatidylglycerol hydrolase [Scleromatobacter humisilvae]MCK9684256.1 type IV secretion system protein VirJ [Scleromatobacter humisilvae]
MRPLRFLAAMRRPGVVLAAALCVIVGPARVAAEEAPSAPAAESQAIAHGLFSDVRVHRPAGGVRQFVLLVIAGSAPDRREEQMLRTMLDEGAMVATVPFAPFYASLSAQDGKCTFGPGAFENLSRHLQAYEHLPAYLLPILVAADDVSPYAYSVLAQAPNGTFEAGLLLGFSSQLKLKTPPCPTHALRERTDAARGTVDLVPSPAALASPWMAVRDDSRPAAAADAARAFVQRVPGAAWVDVADGHSPEASMAAFDRAFRKLAVPQVALGAPPQQLADLPVVELPVAAPGRRLVVLLSGDGGWAGIDKSLGAAFAAQGVPVAGFDSLRYFWNARTPAELAADLDRIIRFYCARWGRSEVLLVGYSQGADVLPFAINRLPPATRASVRLTALLGLGQKASFEFHLANWIGPSGDLPIAPEASRLDAADTLCIYGQDEKDSLCPELAPAHAQAVPLAGGHHFGGEYGALAARILDAAPH